MTQAFTVLGEIRQPVEHLRELAGLFSGIHHRPVNFGKGLGETGKAAVQRLAFQQTAAYPGNNGADARRFGLFDDNVQAFFNGEAGAHQRGKLTGDQGKVTARQTPTYDRPVLWIVGCGPARVYGIHA